MYKHCSTEESALRQRQFENCLLELMHQTPYSQITIGDLCDRMQLSRKSFTATSAARRIAFTP